MAKQPYLPLYYNDIMRTCSTWSDEEFGAYMRLLMEQWDKGFIPKEHERIKRLITSFEKNWPIIKNKFSEIDGVLINEHMEDIRNEFATYSKKQSDNARKGWDKRKEEPKGFVKTEIKTDEIDIWKEDKFFLCQDKLWFSQNIVEKYQTVSKEDLKFYLEQHWLKCRKENRPVTLQQLRAGLQSYINSCEKTKKDKQDNNKTPIKKKGEYDYSPYKNKK